MPAGVDEGLHASVALTYHDDLVARQIDREEIGAAWNLRRVRDDERDLAEDPIAFEFGPHGIVIIDRVETLDLGDLIGCFPIEMAEQGP